MKVFINPGHDTTYDPGACGYDMKEADVALDIGNRVADYLRAAGHEVVVVQSDNLAGERPGLPNVCAEANRWGADMLLSIHCNAFNGEARGIECLVFDVGSDAYQFAKNIQKQLVDTLQGIDPTIPDRGIKERTNLAVLKYTNMPAVLAETAFIDNENDAVLLRDKRDEIAAALARGVTDSV